MTNYLQRIRALFFGARSVGSMLGLLGLMATSAMPVGASDEAHVGWRALSSTGLFSPLRHDTTSVCTATACETAARLITLGVSTGGSVRFVARIGRPGAAGGFSNQTFPIADTGDPQAIGFTTIAVAAPPP